jgi:sugar phosphate isomerase/epimerase
VRLFTGVVPARTSPEATLCRIAAELSVLVEAAARRRVTLVIENNGDFLSSRDLWFVVDAVNHPALKACWNPCNGLARKERSTNAIPRLASNLGLVHVCDADYDDQGLLIGYQLPGHGQVGWDKTIDLLRGVIYRDYLVFEWPKMWVPSLPTAESYLADVAKFLKDRIAHRDPVLSAYKGDKQKPRYPSTGGSIPAPEKAAH